MKYLVFFLGGLLVLFANSCKKPLVYSKGNLAFSNDTVLFDTVFTTVGSTTKRLKIYNQSNLTLKIDEIELMGGEDSQFSINLDGLSGVSFSDIDLPKNDSLFMFVEVTLSVNNGTLPIIIEDSIRFKTNGINQYAQLVVWGQDAYFHVNEIVSDNQPWLTDKPHVIYGLAAVGFPEVDSNLTLTIDPGTQIYVHKNSYLFVYKSALNINGTLGNEVLFRHDRLESFYDNEPGQWGGIILSQSNTSSINYAVIKNAAIGIRVDTTINNSTLELDNTIIDNSQFYNLFLNSGARAKIENCVFGKAGSISTYLFAGGEASFKHCNFVNFWTGSRGGPALAIKNYFEVNDITYVRPVTNTLFENCVMYGNAENELVVDTLIESTTTFNANFRNCLMLREADMLYTSPNFIDIIWNQNPLFTSASEGDYTITTDSPLNNAGTNNGVMLDILENSRNLSAPDIGAYEN